MPDIPIFRMQQKRKRGLFWFFLLLSSCFFLFVPLAVAPSACLLVADATAISTLEDYLAFEDVNTALRSVGEPNIDINLETVIYQLNREPRLSSDLEKLARGLEKRGGRELREEYVPFIRTQGPLQPRYGSFVLEEILDKNREAYASLRAAMLEKSPDVVIGMERGGALAGETIVRGTPLESRFFPLPKTVDPDGKYRFDPSAVLDFVQGKISVAKAENARLGFPDKQVRIAFTDSFFGGRFAHELKQEVVRRLVQRQENVNVYFESYWIRERFGFEKQTAEGLVPLVDKNSLRFPAGLPYASKYDVHLADAPFVLGDDVDLFFDGSAAPLFLFDNQGKVTKIIRPQKTSREALIELLRESPARLSQLPSPDVAAANRAALGIGDDAPPAVRNAVDTFTGSIVCKTGITGAAVKVPKGDSECSQFVVEVTSLDDFKRADRISAYRVEKGKSPFEITFKGENEDAVKSYIEASKNVGNLESETDALLSQLIGQHTVKKEIENQIKDLKSLEELALETYGKSDYRYRRIRFKRIVLDAKFNDPVINPYVEVTKEHKRVAQTFLPTHKPKDVDTAYKIIEGGEIKSPLILGKPGEERVTRGQANSIFFSAGPPYSHLKTHKKVDRHNLPLFLFRKDRIYSNPTFKATPRDSFGYDTIKEVTDHILNKEELKHFIELLVANNKMMAESPQFSIRSDRIINHGTFFPEITIESEIGISDIEKIILTQEQKDSLLSKLRESPEFWRLIGKKLKSNTESELILKEKYEIEVIIPKQGHSIDQTYWDIVGLPIPIYS